MKQLLFSGAIVCSLFIFAGCNQTAADKTADAKTESTETAGTDPAKLKAEMQELETAWANADNARDLPALAAFYSDDAVSMPSNQPMLVGNAAIKKDMETTLAKRAKGVTTSYDVMDAYGSGNYVTEIGKTTRKDSTGKILLTGKYMAIWEKRGGKWICIRDIGNTDAKEN